MACSYILLECAQRDYEDIVRYLALNLGSPKAARRFADEFDKQMRLVCETPELYALLRFPELAKLGYKPLPILRYIALYTVKNGQIVVAHIFHQTQDYAKYV